MTTRDDTDQTWRDVAGELTAAQMAQLPHSNLRPTAGRRLDAAVDRRAYPHLDAAAARELAAALAEAADEVERLG